MISTPKKQFDRMGDILHHSSDDAFEGVAELNQLIEDFGRITQEGAASTKSAAGKSGRKTRKKRTGKKKSTHYLNRDVFDELDIAKDRLKELVPDADRNKVSKSGIVNQALQLILEEFDSKGTKSELVKHLLAKNKADNKE